MQGAASWGGQWQSLGLRRKYLWDLHHAAWHVHAQNYTTGRGDDNERYTTPLLLHSYTIQRDDITNKSVQSLATQGYEHPIIYIYIYIYITELIYHNPVGDHR